MEQELVTLGILFFFALVGGILAARFKQPTLMGLLVVGAAIGPHAFGLIKDHHIMDSMIEFGAILILFILGLEFDIGKLKKIGMKAIMLAVLNSAILTFVGFTLAVILGYSVQVALFIGVILSFGSTVVIVKVLENKGMMDRDEVPLLVAILIIEDIIAVAVITFFSGVQDHSKGLLGNIEGLIISMCVLLITYALFMKFIKPGLEWILKSNNSEEIMTFTALAMCAGFAYFAYAIKLSPAVGAFLAGSIIATLPDSKHFQRAIEPYNLMISAFFFIAIGTLIDVKVILENIWIILLLVFTVIIIKLIAFSGLAYFFANLKGDRMFFASIAMFSIGEFSLLVARESSKFNVGIDLVSIAAAMVAISAVIMSLAITYSDKIYSPTRDKVPYKFRNKLGKFSEYIKEVSDEMDLDNKYSRTLRKNISATAIYLMLFVFSIFGWRRLSLMITDYNLATIGYIAALIASASMLFMTIIKAKKTLGTLSSIFSNATNIRSLNQSKTVITKVSLGFGLILIALTFPFVMFLLELNPLYLLIPYAFIIFAVIQFSKVSRIINKDIDKEYFPKYKKVTLKSGSSDFNINNSSGARKFNEGWKI